MIKYAPSIRSDVTTWPDSTLAIQRKLILEKLDRLERGDMGSFAPGTYREHSYPAIHGQLDADLDLVVTEINRRNNS